VRSRCNRGGHISMTKSMLLLIGLFFGVPLGVAGAQQAVPGNQGLIGTPNRAVPGNQGLIGIPPVQSISPARSPCSAGSQSVRVCNDAILQLGVHRGDLI
jgi:hypothetical protein